MSSPVPLQLHSYDLLLGHKNPMALRLNDAQHQTIEVGDLVALHLEPHPGLPAVNRSFGTLG